MAERAGFARGTPAAGEVLGPLQVDVLSQPAGGAATDVTDRAGRLVGVVTGPLTDAQLRATAVPVSGTFTSTGLTDAQLRALAVPVSGTVTTGGLTDAQLRAGAVAVTLAVAPTTPVTGAFFQATQPVSLAAAVDTSDRAARLLGVVTGPLTDAQLRATAVPVSGAGVAGTPAGGVMSVQGVAGAVAQPVSGAFFQATQPVSLAVAPTTPVTGTFFQATQPVSLAVAPTTPVTGTFFQATQPVSGAFFQATQPVSLAANTPDVTDRAARLLGVIASITGALPAGANSIGTIQQAAITKGAQGATGATTQDLKDAGRNAVTYYMLIPVLTSATDTLQSLTGTKAAATVAATTTPAVVTTGKTFRIQRLWATYVATAVSGYVVVRLRANTAGVVAVTSPVLQQITVGAGTPGAANSVGTEDSSIPDGMEVPAATGIGISAQGFAAATATAVGYVVVGVSGYEY